MTAAVRPKRAAAYVRVSLIGKRRVDTIVSPEVQLQSAESFVRSKGWEFMHELSLQTQDLNVSGFSKTWRKRPGLMRLVQAAERGEIDVIVVYKSDRIGRNLRESLDLLHMLEKFGVTVLSSTEGIDPETKEGTMTRNMLMSVAQYQSELLSERVYDAHLYRAKTEGKFSGGTLPCWCEYAEDLTTIVPIPAMVETMRRLVDLRLAGNGYVRIAKTLNSEGHRMKSGKPWRDGAVYKYLSPTWIDSMEGVGFFNRNPNDPTKEQVRFEKAFPPVLTHDEAQVLRAVQAEYSRNPLSKGPAEVSGAKGWLKGGTPSQKNGRLSPNATHLLSGLCRCGACGNRLLSSLRSKQETYRASSHSYCCPVSRANFEGHKDGGYILSGEALEEATVRVVREFLEFPPEPEERKSPLVTPAEANLRRVSEQIERMLDLFSSGLVEKADFEPKYNALVAERERLRKAYEEETRAEVLRHAERIAGGVEDRKELRSLLALLVESVEAPVYIPGHTVREGLTSLRRYARVTMKYADRRGYKTFLAPIHKSDYKGERKVYPEP